MSVTRRINVPLVAVAVALAAAFIWVAPPEARASSWTSRGPIAISTNTGFTLANGVTGGSGTPQDPYIISGWEISDTGPDNIYLQDTDAHVVLRHLYVHADTPITNGIVLLNVSNGVLEDVRASESRYGLSASASNLVVRNSTFDSNAYDGIAITSSIRVQIENNTVAANRHGLQIVGATDVTISRNTVSSNGLAAGEPSGIVVRDSTRIRIEGNSVVSNALGGVHVETSTNVSVRANTISRTYDGMSLRGVPDAVVIENTFSNDDYAVRLVASPRSRIESNTVNSSRVGLVLEGDILGSSDDVMVVENDIETTEIGIWVAYVRSATVSENQFTGNGFGLGARLVGTSEILVHRNNFVSNRIGAEDEGGGTGNLWDEGYPRGGNYWSDYAGVDACSGPLQNDCRAPDGIGDSAYTIQGTGSDTYPRMALYLRGGPTPPAARFSVTPSPAAVGEAVTVDASSSSDGQDPAAMLEVRWDWEGDGAWDTDWSAAKTWSHAFGAAGAYSIRLEVRDGNGMTNITTRALEIVEGRGSPWLLTIALGAGTAAAGVAAAFLYRSRRRAR